ncbi:MAG TPA: arylsulfatase [Verrucomicrobiales bacterium]|nr:arylsulfatase [Verrucomicrobiales bacterium]
MHPHRLPSLVLVLAVALAGIQKAVGAAADRPPNVVIIFTDDQGYADVGVFGAGGFKTPNLDRLATQGRQFKQFYVAQAVCSASRAALLTGCYPNRIGISGALGPSSKIGIAPGEMTLAELVKQRDYATAIFGKWHLGHLPEFLPMRHGFDQWYGLPYSNDMWPYHPETKPGTWPDLPLFDNDRVVNPAVQPADQEQLTSDYTSRAVNFIRENQNHPFLLYVAHNMPHVPLYVSERFRGRSQRGLYGDVIMEIDWSVGEIMKALDRHQIAEQTLVIFISDNGPWLSYGDHGGSAFPLREGKGTSWEGGVRVPCIMRWPERIPAGTVCNLPLMTIDLLPTIAARIGARLPEHRIDGRDVWPLLAGEAGARNPHDAYFFYYNRNDLEAVLSGDGRWKLVFPHTYRTMAGRPGGFGGQPAKYSSSKTGRAELYDLGNDVTESKDVAAAHPEVVERLQLLADAMRADLGDELTKATGSGSRPPGRAANQ